MYTRDIQTVRTIVIVSKSNRHSEYSIFKISLGKYTQIQQSTIVVTFVSDIKVSGHNNEMAL